MARDLRLEVAADRAGGSEPGRIAGLALAVALAAVTATAIVAVLSILLPRHPGTGVQRRFDRLTLAAATQAGDGEEWLGQTWSFAKLILPLLLGACCWRDFCWGVPVMRGHHPVRMGGHGGGW